MGKILRIKTDSCKWLFGSYDWLSSRKQTEDTFILKKMEKIHLLYETFNILRVQAEILFYIW